jgi:hypothetical protein
MPENGPLDRMVPSQSFTISAPLRKSGSKTEGKWELDDWLPMGKCLSVGNGLMERKGNELRNCFVGLWTLLSNALKRSVKIVRFWVENNLILF